VLEECATSEEASTANNGGTPVNSGHTPPALVSSKVVEMRKENAPYIKAVVDASRSLLRHVIDGLVPKNGLKHAPVRTHFRILSGAMFLLKVCSIIVLLSVRSTSDLFHAASSPNRSQCSKNHTDQSRIIIEDPIY
jgi:hypothetical protein